MEMTADKGAVDPAVLLKEQRSVLGLAVILFKRD